MDFFQHQYESKKKTGRLIVLFCFVLFGLSVLNHVIFSLVIGFIKLVAIFLTNEAGVRAVQDPVDAFYFTLDLLFSWKVASVTIIGTILMMMLLAFFKYLELREGGAQVAEMMGGRRVDRSTTVPRERKLMNVVEEMAIASSVPIPEVYLFDRQRGINAFAAGHTVDDAIIGVTEGALWLLDRDELQGVIAHEFSHILNNDMRLNLRIVVFIYGFVSISVVGQQIQEAGDLQSGLSGEVVGGEWIPGPASDGEEGTNPVTMLFAIGGYCLHLVGSVGTFVAGLVKSAVSREREFLADSSAVQFTRNAEGVTSALKKVGAWESGSRVTGSHAYELSHMFFGSGLPNEEGSVNDSHPPLNERIRLIEPYFDGDFSLIKFPDYPKYKEPEKLAHLKGATILWIEENKLKIQKIRQAFKIEKSCRLLFCSNPKEIEVLLSTQDIGFVVVNIGLSSLGGGAFLKDLISKKVELYVIANELAVDNAIDTLLSEIREAIGKPWTKDKLPVQMRFIEDGFEIYFVGWYGVFLCRSNNDFVPPQASVQNPISSVILPEGVPEVLGLAVLAEASQPNNLKCNINELVVSPKPEHIDFAAEVLSALPDSIRDASRETHDSCALVFSLLLAPESSPARNNQLEIIKNYFGDQMAKTSLSLRSDFDRIDSRSKLPVVDLAIGSLRKLSAVQFVSFKHVIEELIHADEALDLFEYSLSKLVLRHLVPNFEKVPVAVSHIYSLKNVKDECSVLISALANVAGSDEKTIETAFLAGRSKIENEVEVEYLDADSCGFGQIDEALARLNTLEPVLKKIVIEAFAKTVSADDYIQRQEAELLRAISDAIGCPMPPLAVAFDNAA